ncbi:hypothetical protein ACIQ4I_11620 [Rummeliibacillus sp. NPDC094406]|uniref:hypothetical protein n=1 Tax=Rummeliibacillus sp. NPDC094406 TaxID=3364511 RepID=UPI003802C33C
MRRIFLLCCLSIMLFGCNNEDHTEKGKFDIEGKVTDIRADHTIVVKNNNGAIYHVTLPENDVSTNYKIGDHLVIWTSAIDTSNPAIAEALHIEIKSEVE